MFNWHPFFLVVCKTILMIDNEVDFIKEVISVTSLLVIQINSSHSV